MSWKFQARNTTMLLTGCIQTLHPYKEKGYMAVLVPMTETFRASPSGDVTEVPQRKTGDGNSRPSRVSRTQERVSCS